PIPSSAAITVRPTPIPSRQVKRMLSEAQLRKKEVLASSRSDDSVSMPDAPLLFPPLPPLSPSNSCDADLDSSCSDSRNHSRSSSPSVVRYRYSNAEMDKTS